jgi:hypothetical protein
MYIANIEIQQSLKRSLSSIVKYSPNKQFHYQYPNQPKISSKKATSHNFRLPYF